MTSENDLNKSLGMAELAGKVVNLSGTISGSSYMTIELTEELPIYEGVIYHYTVDITISSISGYQNYCGINLIDESGYNTPEYMILDVNVNIASPATNGSTWFDVRMNNTNQRCLYIDGGEPSKISFRLFIHSPEGIMGPNQSTSEMTWSSIGPTGNGMELSTRYVEDSLGAKLPVPNDKVIRIISQETSAYMRTVTSASYTHTLNQLYTPYIYEIFHDLYLYSANSSAGGSSGTIITGHRYVYLNLSPSIVTMGDYPSRYLKLYLRIRKYGSILSAAYKLYIILRVNFRGTTRNYTLVSIPLNFFSSAAIPTNVTFYIDTYGFSQTNVQSVMYSDSTVPSGWALFQ